MSNLIEAGKITSLHSFKGEVKIQNWCDSVDFFMQFNNFYLDDGEILEINKMRKSGNMIIASFSGVENEADAIKLKNKIIYIDKDEAGLEEGVFFVVDLLGLPVINYNTGEKYGILSDIFNNGATDIYVVDCGVREDGKKREAMVPNVSEFIKKVSLEEGVFIVPIEGMFI